MLSDQADSNNSMHNEEQVEDSAYSLLLSRRHFLYGTLGIGALALAAANISTPSPAFADEEEFSYLSVSNDSVFTLDDCTELPYGDAVALIGNFELPYGTLLWASNDEYAACLFPTESSKPLTKMGVLYLTSGNYATLLEAPVSMHEGFDIYDVRASERGFVWTEANILSGTWRIYTASFNGESLGEAILVDEGGEGWETPTIAAVGTHAYWQVLPIAAGPYTTENSILKRATIGSNNYDEIYHSQGRMSSPIYPLGDGLVITPRTPTDAIHHQLTLLDGSSGETRDSLVLPQGMKPLEAGYGTTGFNFSFEGIYSYGEGISNLGTYTPEKEHGAYDYENKTWFRFSKTPSSPPAWCKNHFIVKSTRSVCGVNLESRLYYAIDVESGSDSYGDYLASTGDNDSFVTYANINSKSMEGEVKKYCLVRVWTPHE
ncbi:MAG: twin-arginine translocation signal domain-containing protein [Raoultibacter sp.]